MLTSNIVFRKLVAILVGITIHLQVMGEDPSMLYEEWHLALASQPELTEPLWLSVDGPEKLAGVVRKIDANRIRSFGDYSG